MLWWRKRYWMRLAKQLHTRLQAIERLHSSEWPTDKTGRGKEEGPDTVDAVMGPWDQLQLGN